MIENFIRSTICILWLISMLSVHEVIADDVNQIDCKTINNVTFKDFYTINFTIKQRFIQINTPKSFVIKNCKFMLSQTFYREADSSNKIAAKVKTKINLNPCTYYEFSFLILNSGSNQRFWKYEQVRTLDLLPSISKLEQIVDKSDNGNSLKVTWKTRNADCVASYKVHLKAFPDYTPIEVKTEENFAHFENLDACTTYSISLEATDKTDKVLQNIAKNFSTSFKQTPGALENITAEVYDSYVDITWLPPKIGFNCITEFVIMYTNKRCLNEILQTTETQTSETRILPPDIQTDLADERSTNSSINCWITRKIHKQQNNIKLENLKKCQQFEFLVFGNGALQPKIESLQKYEFRTNSGNIGAVHNLAYFRASSISVRLSWTEPKVNIECLDHYLILVNDQVYSSTERHFTVTDLKSCKANYTIKVQPVATEGLEGDQQTILINMDTNLLPPSQLSNLQYNQSDDEVIISWSPPDYGSQCNSYYKIKQKQFYPEVVSFINTTEEFIVLKDLMPCIKYSVEVSAVSVADKEGLMNVFNIRKNPRVSKPPTSLRFINSTSTSLSFFTNLTDFENKCEVYSIEFSCQTAKHVIPLKHDETMIEATIDNLRPFTNYSCAATVSNVAGWSHSSDMMVFQTAEGKPERPQNISEANISVNSSSIEIEWKTPKTQNGLIIGYQVTFNYNILECASTGTLKIVNKTDTKFSIQEPIPFAIYTFKVAALNRAYIGEEATITVQTLPTRPSSSALNFKVDSQTNPLLDGYNVTITLTWEIQNCSSNGKIYQFYLSFHGNRSDNLTEHSFNRTLNVSENKRNDFFTWEESEVMPEFLYNVKLFTKVRNVDELSDPTEVCFKSSAGVPFVSNDSFGYIDKLPVSHGTEIILDNSLFTFTMGQIVRVVLIFSNLNCNTLPKPKRDLLSKDDLLFSNNESKDCTNQQMITLKPIDYSNDSNCSVIIGKNNDIYLEENADYAVIFRIYTSAGFCDTTPILFKTAEGASFYDISIYIGAGSAVFLVFVLSAISVLIYCCIKKRKSKKNKKEASEPDDSFFYGTCFVVDQLSPYPQNINLRMNNIERNDNL